MNKGRIESFTDAIVAIITTIMVLEIKTPETYKLEEIIKELPYLFSYATSFFFILLLGITIIICVQSQIKLQRKYIGLIIYDYFPCH